MNMWIILIVSLPTGHAATRMRVWRAIRAAGAAVLRDGVYLLPAKPGHRDILSSLQAEVLNDGGSALLVDISEPEGTPFAPRFDRTDDYRRLDEQIVAFSAALNAVPHGRAIRESRRLRKAFEALSAIDFFPGEARMRTESVLRLTERTAMPHADPSEPCAADWDSLPLQASDFQQQIWATGHRPGVDRLASAWLIRRFIDPQARFLWLPSPSACPANAIGFDFDGARFSHTGSRVTYEVLLASFDLRMQALHRIGTIVHALDVGGEMPAEAGGIECVLAGMRNGIASDDVLLESTATIFDALLDVFSRQESERNT